MEIQLQELIDQIKRDGVEAAATEAEAVLKAAKAEAERKAEEERIAKEKERMEKEAAQKKNDELVEQYGNAFGPLWMKLFTDRTHIPLHL